MFLLLLLLVSSNANARSIGCGSSSSVKLGELTSVNFGDVRGENGLVANRDYAIYIPSIYDSSKAYALGFWFHGWSVDYMEEAKNTAAFQQLQEQTNSFIMVWPRGMGDFDGDLHKEYYDSWNYGVHGESADITCTSWAESYCYDSCISEDVCSKCDWTTCYDDVAFIRGLLEDLKNKYCIDEDRIYISGESNGGMFMHYLTNMMDDIFAAVMPIFGLPMKDHWWMPKADDKIAYLHFHGRWDMTVPWDGSLSITTGFKYLAGLDVLAEWANHHNCDQDPVQFQTSVTFKARDNVICMGYPNCSSGKLVGYCLFNGWHMWIEHTEELVWWFWENHNNSVETLNYQKTYS